MSAKPRVLVVCTGNSMRSQMAEGLLRHDLGERIDVFSAGTHPSRVHPMSIRTMAEAGIDISGHRSKSIAEFFDVEMDLVITVCDSANLACPVFPNAKKTIHRGYPDPIDPPPGTEVADLFADLRDQMRVELAGIVIRELNLA